MPNAHAYITSVCADLELGLKGLICALDSTTIDLCLSRFSWADFRQTKAAVNAHALLDLRAAIPLSVSLRSGKIHDVKILDVLMLPTGSLLVADLAYLAFKRLHMVNSHSVGFSAYQGEYPGVCLRASPHLGSTWCGG